MFICQFIKLAIKERVEIVHSMRFTRKECIPFHNRKNSVKLENRETPVLKFFLTLVLSLVDTELRKMSTFVRDYILTGHNLIRINEWRCCQWGYRTEVERTIEYWILDCRNGKTTLKFAFLRVNIEITHGYDTFLYVFQFSHRNMIERLPVSYVV